MQIVLAAVRPDAFSPWTMKVSAPAEVPEVWNGHSNLPKATGRPPSVVT